MNCKKVRRLLSDCIDGHGKPGTEARVKEHLAGCESCKEVYDQLVRLDTAIKAAAEPAELPREQQEEYWANYWQRLQPKLLSDGNKRAPIITFWDWTRLAAAAALLLCVFTGLLALKQHQLANSLRTQLDATNTRLRELRMWAAPSGDAPLVVNDTLAARDVMLFREMDATFAGALKWVATDGDKIDLGMSQSLSSEPSAAEATREGLLAIQLSIFTPGQGENRLLNRARLVVREGCKAEFSTGSGGLDIGYACLGTVASDTDAVIRLAISISAAERQGATVIDTNVRLHHRQEVEVARVIWHDMPLVIRAGLVILRTPKTFPRTGTST